MLLVVDNEDKSDILLDGMPLQGVQWSALSQNLGKKLVGTQVRISYGQHNLQHRQNASFMAYVYGSVQDDCSYAFPAGSKLQNITAVSA